MTNIASNPSARPDPIGISAGEGVGAGLARIGVGQFGRVAEGLAGRPDRDTGTHEARKALKRLRALLWLVRSHLDEPRFRRDDAGLRDVGRALAPLRDARVAVDTLDELAPGMCPALRTGLESRHAEELGALLGDPVVLENLSLALGAGRSRWAAAFPGTLPDGFEAVARGLSRTFKRGRKRMRRAIEQEGDGDFHEWRKSVKHLRYQVEALRPLDPNSLTGSITPLGELGDVLGIEHDLTMLIGFAGPAGSGSEDRAGLLDLLSERRAGLRVAAATLGTSVFAPRASVFVASIKDVWKTAMPQDEPN